MSLIQLDVTRFYNGQSGPFQQKFVYTKPDTDFREENGNAYWNVDAPPKNFFTMPFELETQTGGVWRINIHREITERFGNRGLVRIDANSVQLLLNDLQKETPAVLIEMARRVVDNHDLDEFRQKVAGAQFHQLNGLLEKEAINHSNLLRPLAEYTIITAVDNRWAYVAFDDASAKIKGDALWRKYLRQQIDDFEYENNRRVTERGQTPLRPREFIAHAYKELGMQVPGDEKYVQAGVQQTEVGELKATVAQQAKQIETLLEFVRQRLPEVASAEGHQQEAVGATAGNGATGGKEKQHTKK